MQAIEFIGNLVADPTPKTTPTGVNVTSFTVAVTRAFKNAQGDKVSDFFRVNAWRQTADYASKYLTKGSRVYVRGELQPVLFDGRDGRQRLDLSVQADRVENLTEKAKEPEKEKPVSEWDDISSDDLPFGR